MSFKIFKNRLEKVLFIKKLKNLPTEIFSNNYVLLSSSINPFFHNWGDDASVILAQLINPSIKVIPAQYSFNIRKKKEVLSVGSIITWLTKPSTIIWGSGMQVPTDPIMYNGVEVKPYKVAAVRGPLTRKHLLQKGIDCPEVFGDPALLFPRYYKPNVSKKYKYGIIPHFKDKKSESLKPFLDNKNFHIIDIQDFSDWRNFINEINSCEFIISSSLHGIIIADAYEVPNCWVEFDSVNLKRFTFQDYFHSVGKSDINEPLKISEIQNPERLSQLKNEWKPVVIDLDKLLEACPFAKK